MNGNAPHWLTAERATAYARLALVSFVVIWLARLALPESLFNPRDLSLKLDFMAFWAASHLALTGHAVDAYDMHQLLAAEQVALPAAEYGLAWLYLPPFYLVILPLALLPYPEAYLLFMIASLLIYVVVLRETLNPLPAGIFIAAFPGLWLNLLLGQNGFLTAALAGGALLLMQRRPVAAGVLIGLLVIKPQLAILFPVALIAARAWPTFLAAGLTAMLFTALSTWLMGMETLAAGWASLGAARQYLEAGRLPWAKMPTVFAFMRHLGAPVMAAYAGHCLVASLTMLSVWRVWRRSEDGRLRGAVLMTATLMVTPYLYDYDLTWLAFPIAWLASCGIQDGWRPGERWLLAAAWFFPMLAAPLARATELQFGPLVAGLLLWMTWRRATTGADARGTS